MEEKELQELVEKEEEKELQELFLILELLKGYFCVQDNSKKY